MTTLTRRAALLAFAVAGAALPALAFAVAGPLAPGVFEGAQFRSVSVDVSPLTANGSGPIAGWAANDLTPDLNAAFAAHLAPGARNAPRLVVRIDEIALGADNGASGGSLSDSGRARDHIVGTGLVVAPNGRTIAQYPLFSVLYAFIGASQYSPGTERGRVADLSRSFAQWLPRQMGL
jgi:hypothetical protein